MQHAAGGTGGNELSNGKQMLQADAKDGGIAIRQFLSERAGTGNQYVIATGMRHGGRERCHAPSLSAQRFLAGSLGPSVRPGSGKDIAVPCAEYLGSILLCCGFFRKRAGQTARK